MRDIEIDDMTEDMQIGIMSGLNNLFYDYFRDKEDTVVVNYESHTLLSNWWEVSLSTVYANHIPVSIRYGSDIDIYTVSTESEDIQYIPNMLINKDKNTIVLPSVTLGNNIVSYMLLKMFNLVLERRFDVSNSLWRTVQSVVKLKGVFKQTGKFTAYEKDETRHSDNSTPKIFTRRKLR